MTHAAATDTAHATDNANVVHLDAIKTERHVSGERNDDAMAALQNLQDALNAAIKAGVVVEPDIKIVGNRYSNLGTSADSYQITINAWLKLP